MISPASSSNAARVTTPPGSACPIRAPLHVAASPNGVPGARNVCLSKISLSRFGLNAGASVREGVNIEVSQASPAIAMTGRLDMARVSASEIKVMLDTGLDVYNRLNVVGCFMEA